MIEVTEILALWAGAVHDDSGLQGWCTANLGALPKVYEGMEDKDVPGETDAPFVGMSADGKDVGEEARVWVYGLRVICAIVAATRTVADRRYTYTGVRLMEQFETAVFDVLETASGNVAVSRASHVYVYDRFPLMYAEADVRVVVPHTIGGAVVL